MIESKVVDIIIPVFNKQDYLEDLINHLTPLCSEKANIIFVDDGSTDRSLEILNSNSRNNFFVFTKENGGVSSARNLGIYYSVSDYIWFVDPDDLPDLNVIDSLNYYLHSSIDVFVFNYKKKYLKKNKIVDYTFDKYGLIDSNEFINNYGYFNKKNNMSYIWNKLYSRSAIGNTRFDENISLSEDRRFNIEIFNKLLRIQVINKFNYIYHVFGENTLSSDMNLDKINAIYYTNLLNFKLEKNIRPCFKSHLIHQLILRSSFSDFNAKDFYFNEHKKHQYNVLPFFSFKEFIFFILILFNIFKIAIFLNKRLRIK